jgi:hypothetical protein
VKYRKKPVVIDAVKLERRFDWPDWFYTAVTNNTITTFGLGKFGDGDVYCIIKTLEGDHRASDGDYIIRGVKGEIYPVRADIFRLTYDEV